MTTYSLSARPGATFGKFVLTSEWVDNKRATVTVIVAGPTGALGFEAAYAEGDISMHDYSDSIQPTNFQASKNGGWFFDMHAAGGAGVGTSIFGTTLGNVFSDRPINIGFFKGAEVTLGSLTLGSSTLWDVQWEERCP